MLNLLTPWTFGKHVVASIIATPLLVKAVRLLLCRPYTAASIGIIGGADGPTVVFISGKLVSHYGAYLGVLVALLVLYWPVSRLLVDSRN